MASFDMHLLKRFYPQASLEIPSKDLQNASGDTALMHAALKGHMEVVRLLFEAGADKDLKSAKDAAAWHYASENGHVEIVALLRGR